MDVDRSRAKWDKGKGKSREKTAKEREGYLDNKGGGKCGGGKPWR